MILLLTCSLWAQDDYEKWLKEQQQAQQQAFDDEISEFKNYVAEVTAEYDAYEQQEAKEFEEFKKAVEEKWPDAWKDFDTLLPKSNAFRALMRHLGDTAYLEAVDGNIGEIPTSEDFFKILDRVELKDSDFTTKNFVHGAGGQMMLYKVLSGQMDASELFEAKT